MFKKKIKFFFGIFLAFFIFFAINNVGANEFTSGYKKTGNEMGYNVGESNGSTKIEETITLFINIVLSFLGVIFLILMIYAGYTWMLARGNESEIEKSKNIIISSIIGLIVVISAYAVTKLVGSFI